MKADENCTVSLMDRLKESTRAMHESAETSNFQGRLTNGALSLELYVLYLEQLYLLHAALEKGIDKNPVASKIVSEEQHQEPFLKEDLEQFGREPQKIYTLSSTNNFLSEIQRLSDSCPLALLGIHYVLLGSKHGGKFIARNCKESYKLRQESGVRYFDPYGQNFMPIWKAFKEEMNTLKLSSQEENEICAAASATFKAVYEIGKELETTV